MAIVTFIGVFFGFFCNDLIKSFVLHSWVDEVMKFNPIVRKSIILYGYAGHLHILYAYWSFFIPPYFFICYKSKVLNEFVRNASFKKWRMTLGLFLLLLFLFTWPSKISSTGPRKIQRIMLLDSFFSVIFSALAWFAISLFASVIFRYAIFLIKNDFKD